MKQPWFKKAGWTYLPIHAMGILVTLGAISFLVAVCIAKSGKDIPVSANTGQIFVYSSCTIFWWTWIADKTSEK